LGVGFLAPKKKIEIPPDLEQILFIFSKMLQKMLERTGHHLLPSFCKRCWNMLLHAKIFYKIEFIRWDVSTVHHNICDKNRHLCWNMLLKKKEKETMKKKR
jgi:hypothetical protein